MKRIFSSVRRRKVWLGALTALLSATSFAQIGGTLPDAPAPTKGDGGGNFLLLAQNWASDAVLVIGVILAAFAFIYVVRNVMSAYAESQDGKGSIAAVMSQALIGVVIIGFVILLITQASGIF